MRPSSRRRAGPLGFRTPCSHASTVRLETPQRWASQTRDFPIWPLHSLISAPVTGSEGCYDTVVGDGDSRRKGKASRSACPPAVVAGMAPADFGHAGGFLGERRMGSGKEPWIQRKQVGSRPKIIEIDGGTTSLFGSGARNCFRCSQRSKGTK